MPLSVKSCRVCDTVISITATCLLVIRLASYKGQELYSGLVTELGNQHDDDKGEAQRAHPEGLKPKCHVETDCPVVVMKLL